MFRRISFLSVVVVVLCVPLFAQAQECPVIMVTCASVSHPRIGFTANVIGLPLSVNPVFKWKVSTDQIIIRAQSMDSIEVEIPQDVDQVITASVETSGVPRECNNTAVCRIRVVPDRYPTIWWEPIEERSKFDWEILPQEAKPGEVILSKRHELGLLSNFAATPFTFHGKRYASLEGFWQAMLYPEGPNDPRAKFPGLEWKYTREQVAQMTAFEAKRAGDQAEENMRKMKIAWVSFEGKRFAYRPKQAGRHYRLIVAATRAKVLQNQQVKKVLLATGDLTLRPDHHQEPNAPAAWRYFEILMNIRKVLQRR